jgi:hypothetical protein
MMCSAVKMTDPSAYTITASDHNIARPYTATISKEVWVALIAPVAAIIASFGAQIIGGIFSRKQEKRRLDLEERKLFADTLRVAFVSYLQTRNGLPTTSGSST